MAEKHASSKGSSLLDALDSSAFSSESPHNQAPAEFSESLLRQHAPKSTQSQSPFALVLSSGASGSGGGGGGVMDRAAMSHADINTDFLSSSLGPSSPLRRLDGGGFRLNYDFETPIRSIDLGGPDQAQRMAEFVTRSIDNLSHGLTVRTAMESLGLKDKRDLIPGLEVRLLSHQAIGVTWMLAKEKSSDRGGILADDMGLGKTVQMIATMVKNMPNIDDECKTTLIIVPAALLQQWKEEVETKTNGVFSVHVHHGKDKLKKTSQVQKYDVIVTTYQTLNQDFNIPKDCAPDEEAAWLADNGGVLARTKFYRAVADEAQFIRNRATRSSITMAHVKAKYRWMLTGTPVTNTLADIYGLLRFGRFRPWNDWNAFNDYVAKLQSEDAPLAGSRAQAILNPILLRRTKDSSIEGSPILELPPKGIELVQLQFSEEERDLYNSFEKKTKIRLTKFIRERTLVKNHAAVLVMILRMRQLCCHPNLILSQADGYEDPTLLVGSGADKELGRARKIMGAQWIADVKSKFLTRALANEVLDFSDETDTPDTACPVCSDVYMNDSGHVLACGHEICFECLLNLKNSPIEHDGIFGYGTEKENIAIEKEYETAAAKGYRPCPTCKKMMDLSPNKAFISSAFEPTDEELSNHARVRRRGRREVSRRFISQDAKMRSPSPKVKDLEDRALNDSDDDLPDVSNMFDERPRKRHKKSAIDDNDLVDLTIDDITAPLSGAYDTSNSSEVEVVGNTQSPAKHKGGRGRPVECSPTPSSTGKRPANQRNNDPDRDGPSDAVIATWKRGDDDLEPSAKMLALIKLLKEWDLCGDKTICYSQWTSMLDLIEILFSRHGIQSLRFDGKMSREARDATLATFKKPGGPKVILISTRCGSVGLNLVSANRIINMDLSWNYAAESQAYDSMDLSWNYAAESQAYDRVHRIGQEKPVFVKRLVVENTIEERMLKLQDVKVGLAEAALGEGTGAKLHKLSVKDIKYLFGMAPAKDAVPKNQTTLPIGSRSSNPI